MKTGKTIVRVLAVILLLSMLVGFTPAMPAASQDDGGAVVLADPVDGQDNDGSTGNVPGDNEGGNDPAPGDSEGGNDPAPGDNEGGNDPAPGDNEGGNDPAPGDGEGGSTEPEVKKVAVTFDGNVTVMAGEAALESGAEVEVGTELAITVKTANVAAAILVNGEASEGAYTVAEKDEAVEIKAFGISKVEISSEKEWKTAKDVTVTVFGDVATVNGVTVSGNTVTLPQTSAASETGRSLKITAVSKDNAKASAAAEVVVKKIDTAAPKVAMSDQHDPNPKVIMVKSWEWEGWSRVEREKEGNQSEYYIAISDLGGSEVDEKSITVTGYYYSRDFWSGTVSEEEMPKRHQATDVSFDKETGELYFVGYHNYFGSDTFFKITVKDHAGNETVFYTNKSDSSEVKFDEEGPQINQITAETTRSDRVMTDVPSEPNPWVQNPKDYQAKPYIVGPNSTLMISAYDESSIWEVQLGDKVVEADGYPVDYTAVFSAKDLAELGTGTFSVSALDHTGWEKENANRSNASVQISLVYDDQAPALKNVTITDREQTSFEKIAHAVTGGLMFHQNVQVSLELTEEGGAGLYAYYYQFSKVGEDGKTSDPSEWYILPADSRSVSEKDGLVYLSLPVPAEGDTYLTGDIAVSVYAEDNAGNISIAEKGEPESTQFATHDGTTQSEDGNLVVFAYTPATGDEQIPYNADLNGFVKELGFDVRYNLDQLKIYEAAKKPAVLSDNSEWYVVTNGGFDIQYSLSENAATSKSVKPHTISEDQSTGKWIAGYGDNGNVACDGILTITVTPKISVQPMKAVDQTPAATEENPNPEKVYGETANGDPITFEKRSVTIPVKVQNYIDQATVSAKSHENTDNAVTFNLKDGSTYGWYNDLDKFLDDVRVIAPESKADFTTTYSVKFLKNQSFADQEAQDKAWAGANEKASDKLTTAKEDKALFDQENIFNEEGLYLITISTIDDLGNVPAPEEESFVIKYDVKAPEISANFTETHTAEDTYYDIQRTGTITITDLAFTGDPAETERFTVKADPEIGSPAEKGEWKYDKDNQKWSIVYTYGVKSGDAAKDGDNYKLSVDVVDNAGNKSSTTTDGILTKNGKNTDTKVYYTGDNATGFTIDQTAPVVSVSFNNNNVRNGKYFNASRTATITVVEHNFDPARVTLVATGASAGAAAAEGWSQNGDTWTKTVTFGRDANCKFSIDVVDKAGNVCPNANVRYSGAATADFVIDMTRPNVQYTGVDASPYGEACTPGFTATDTNLGNEFTYKLSRKTMKGEEDVSNLLNHAGSAARFSYSDIPNSRDDDGIYTFTCSVTDLAGNVTTLNPVEFAVNRHGSVYLLNKELQNVVGKYFNEEGWAKVNDGNLVITEYNPTPLKDDAKLEIYRDGTRVATYTGDALKKLVSGGDRGGLGLYEYAYKLPAADFAEDGSYRVVLSSTDANDHKSGNDKTGAEINFVIDTVSPEIVSISGLEKRTVNAEEQPVGFHILDTYGLDSVAIRTAGPDGAIVKEYISQAKYDAQNGKLEPYQQLLPEGELDLTDEIILIQNNTPYHVVISVTDKAGNTTVADGGSIVSSTEAEAMTPSYDFQDSVTVSTNFFVRYIHNTGALIGTGVGAAALAGLWLVLAKRKKDDEEKKTA